MQSETTETDALQVPVLVVGGALVGLSMSLFLSWQGVPSLLVEKHPQPARLPRARGYNARTMELFRVLGLEEAIRAAQLPIAQNQGMVRVESLAGREIARLDEDGQADLSALSPTAACIIGQQQLEPILLDAAKRMGSDIRFNSELVSFEQDETGVSAVIRERVTGREWRVRAHYLIAADGAHSSIRDALGIQTQGPGTISYSTNVSFEADLREALRGRRIFLYYVSNPHLPDGQAGLMPDDNERRWFFGTPIHPERGERREDMTDERCIELIRIAVGMPDLEVKILPAYPWDPIKVGVWELAARYAESYRKGRVFLAGDAAHTVLPSGGLGAGTGIQDAFNLAWKLALVLAGKAGTGLLDSYESERLPVGKLVVEQTLQRQFYRTGTAESTLVDSADLIFGFRYRSAAIVAEPGANEAPLTQHPSTLCGEPGTRAPHIMLERDGLQISTIDLCGGRWTLLVGDQGTLCNEAAHRVSKRLELPLSVYTIGAEHGLKDVEGRWDAAYGVGAAGAVLVRPDGFVAWRSSTVDEQPELALEKALVRVLALC
ncbi:MAG: FAD-dependent monooxygenase [Ktedonobacteraceae bacterium]|nr:FAD-dependent monooxygenase [Ktedonobacteraceae bacterium]